MQELQVEIENEKQRRRRYRVMMTAMLLSLGIVTILSFGVGYYPLSPSQVVGAFLSGIGYEQEILPQAVTIFWKDFVSCVYRGVAFSCGGGISGNVSKPISFA